MSKIEIVVGTTLGNAEYVADELANTLIKQGHKVITHNSPSLDQLDLSALWLIVSSTHGAGDLPNNIHAFFDDLNRLQPDLSKLKFALCAIGDSNYDTYCQGPEMLYKRLIQLNATAFTNILRIDMSNIAIPEDCAQAWLLEWNDRL